MLVFVPICYLILLILCYKHKRREKKKAILKMETLAIVRLETLFLSFVANFTIYNVE